MQKIFSNPSQLEKTVKEKYNIPDFLMMENAALFMANHLRPKLNSTTKVFILCGKGNNGGDGFALARLIYGQCLVTVCAPKIPTAPEALRQYEIFQKIGQIQTELKLTETPDIIVDCLYGTGFHGGLSPEEQNFITGLNNCNSYRLACDIPSALEFKADCTITMGSLKTVLYSDKAKACCGEILEAEIGLPQKFFQQDTEAPAFLITKEDIKLPVRTNPAAHKGTYGHTAVIAGEKSGAAIIAATAAMNLGSGLTTLVKTENSNLSQFKISPELMISETLPAKTTAVCFGSGIGGESLPLARTLLLATPSNGDSPRNAPALVLDAGFFDADFTLSLLFELNKNPEAKIVLTPHLSELNRFLVKMKNEITDFPFTEEEITVKNLAQKPDTKIKIGNYLNKLFPQTAVIMKSANTFIAAENQIFIVTEGTPNLAKGGSGDVLAGMTGALLAQNYTPKEAAITATYLHAKAAATYGSTACDLTPEKLIAELGKLISVE
ncbi:MAG: NAD(P)H-hydrate epimerase [Treponema sp.]|nr:NAD(P)H-hydrate epimerase [Treponema sp.]